MWLCLGCGHSCSPETAANCVVLSDCPRQLPIVSYARAFVCLMPLLLARVCLTPLLLARVCLMHACVKAKLLCLKHACVNTV